MAGDTAAPGGESAPDIAETDGVVEEFDPETTVAELIECLPLSKPTIPFDPSQN